MSEPERLEEWRLAVDEQDDLTIVGEIGGRHDGGLLAETRHRECGLVRLRDGRWLTLGTPHPDVAHDPWAVPEGYAERRLARLMPVLERLRAGDGPTQAELAAAPLLETWGLQPSAQHVVLCGYVTDHPRLVDGDWITTSPVVWMAADRQAARTVSRWYRLGNSVYQALNQSDLNSEV